MSIHPYKSIWSEKRSLINVESHVRQYLDARQILGSTHKHSFVCARHGVAEEFHHEHENKHWIQLGQNLLKPDFARRLLGQGQKLRTGFQSFLLHIRTQDIEALGSSALARLFEQACVYHMLFRALFKTSRGEFTTAAENKLKDLLTSHGIGGRLLENYFETLTSPGEYDDVNREAIDWLELLERRRVSLRILLRHADRYPWLVAHTYDPKLIIGTLRERFQKDSVGIRAVRRDIAFLHDQKRRLRSKQQRRLRSLGDPKINYLSWLFREFSLERMRLKGGWAGSDYLYYPLYSTIARRAKITLNDLYTNYRIQDVLNALAEQAGLSQAELTQRHQAYAFILNHNKLEFYCGHRAERVILETLPESRPMSKKEVSGTVASCGQALGRVRIVIPGDIEMLNNSMHDFRPGEILVTTMTQPNMVPIMKKARAIVTDEGGLTSHASIIARELGRPCIVGTQVATKIFRTGDKVSVDAYKGLVLRI